MSNVILKTNTDYCGKFLSYLFFSVVSRFYLMVEQAVFSETPVN